MMLCIRSYWISEGAWVGLCAIWHIFHTFDPTFKNHVDTVSLAYKFLFLSHVRAMTWWNCCRVQWLKLNAFSFGITANHHGHSWSDSFQFASDKWSKVRCSTRPYFSLHISWLSSHSSSAVCPVVSYPRGCGHSSLSFSSSCEWRTVCRSESPPLQPIDPGHLHCAI